METSRKKPQIGNEREKFHWKLILCLFMLYEHIASGFSIIHIYMLQCIDEIAAMSMWKRLRGVGWSKFKF